MVILKRYYKIFTFLPITHTIKSILSNPFGLLRNGIIGSSVRIDASTRCQLECPACTTTDGIIDKGDLSINKFKNLIEKNSWIRSIELSNCGELFLNPDIIKIMRLAKHKKIALTAYNGSNLNDASDEILEALVKYSFRFLSISIDGASQDVYAQYRRGGRLKIVLSNIKKINKYKAEYKSRYPELRWQFILFGHNAHEIEEARRMAQGLDMKFRVKLNADQSYSPIKNASSFDHNVRDRNDYRKTMGRPYTLPCYQIWYQPVINWNGELLGCCRNMTKSFGNVFDGGLTETLNGRRYRLFKDALLGKIPMSDRVPCHECEIYRYLNES